MLSSCGTTLPTTSASMSMKFCASLSTKYSSAMLRPPTTAIAPSAMKSLLCMRWLRRWMSKIDTTKRDRNPSRAQQNGLNRRTDTFGVSDSASNSCWLFTVYRSSTSTRTFTPRAAASRSVRSSSRPVASFSSW
ncbi:hypothetical protein D3C72_849410 [compost metagenome]